MTVGRSTGLTDTGRKRRRNEDAYVLAPPVFAVADGMGGAQAGEVASKLAAAAIAELSRLDLEGEEAVAELIQEANRRVFERASEDPSASGMGTTVTVALVEDGKVAIGHVGDSRAYLVRGGRLEQLTEDHSLVAELMKSGKLSPAEAETHPQRSVITRALGTDPDVDVDTFTVEAEPGDVFLLCSDGLTSMVSDRAILDLLEQHRGDLDRAARVLVEAANRGGGEDNITVVAFEIAGGGGDAAELEKTVAMTAPAPDEEDTLHGVKVDRVEVDRVEADRAERTPAVETMVVRPGEGGAEPASAATAEPVARERTRPARRRARVRLVLAMVLLLAVAAAALVVWGLLH